METIPIRKDAIEDLVRVQEDFDNIIESLTLMADEEFMNSYRAAKEQIRRRDLTPF
jgi:hypothetical protein